MNIMRVIVWFVDEPGRVLVWARWQVRLWLAGYRDRVVARERSLTMYYADYGWPWRWLRDFVERISPFDPWKGYSRVFVRQWLWKASHPLITERLSSLRWMVRLLTLVTPYAGPGKYEQFDPATRLKVEWLDSMQEDATETTGDVAFGVWLAAFVDFDVPWSRQPENWTLSVNSFGFVAAQLFDDEDAIWTEFGALSEPYTRWLNANDPSHVYGQ